MGKVDLNDWKEWCEKLIIDTTYKTLNEYSNQLDEYTKRGGNLINEAKEIVGELESELDKVKNVSFLPLYKICKYLE